MASLPRWLTRKSTVLPLFFLLLVGVSLAGFEAYGVSWDEPNMVRVGEDAYNYVFEGQPWATENAQRFYGTAFELPLSIARHVLNITDERGIFLLRHLLTFWLFIVGVYFFYRLARHQWRSWRVGLLAALFLVLSPRIFADAFYNSKDIPAMVSFIISMYTLVLVLERKTWRRIALHALATAFVIGVRITGVVVPAFTVLFLLIHSIRDARERNEKLTQFVPQTAAYLILSTIATVAAWPFLWQSAVAHFLEAYRFMSSIGIDTFYMGEQIHQLPWHYVFVWIGITTPILYTILFLLGLLLLAVRFIANPPYFLYHRSNDALFLLWFFLPIAAVFATGAGIFDGWRHLYFLYPAFLLIAMEGLQSVWRPLKELGQGRTARRLRGSLAIVIALNGVYLSVWMVLNHPIQNVYFALPKQFIEGKFELDYWGLSFRKGIEYVLANDPRPQIRLYFNSSPGFSTLFILPKVERDRITIGSSEQDADYFLTDYRFHYTSDYPYTPFKIFTVDGIKIMGVYTVR